MNEIAKHIVKKIAQLRMVQCHTCRKDFNPEKKHCDMCHKIDRGVEDLLNYCEKKQ